MSEGSHESFNADQIKICGNTDRRITEHIHIIHTKYCSVLFHSSLTQEQSDSIEKIQSVCLRVILGDNYVSYVAALEMCALEKLSLRREKRCLSFSLKSIVHPQNKRMFPLAEVRDEHNLRNREQFKVNFARTETYARSSAGSHSARGS